MTHGEMNELYELYVLGVLEAEEKAAIDQHVAEHCEYCVEQIREASHATTMLSSLAESVAAPAAVRERLLAGLQSKPQLEPVRPQRPKRSWLFPVAALGAACLVLIASTWYTASQLAETRTTLNRIAAERDQLRSALEILSRSQTRTVQFGSSDQVAHGRVFVNPNGGFVFVGSDLPSIAQDRTFELWFIPAQGAPQPAGLVNSETGGSVVHASQTPVDVAQVKAVAVTVEPRAGSNSPTTKPFLIVPLG